jgi:hypothetical protein
MKWPHRIPKEVGPTEPRRDLGKILKNSDEKVRELFERHDQNVRDDQEVIERKRKVG